MEATIFSREVLGSVVDVTCVKRGMGGGCFSFFVWTSQKRDVCTFHLQQKNTKNRVSTKELDEKIEGTYLTELSLQADDVATNAQSTHRLVLKH